MYGEDTDLSIRARQAGATCLICPDARLIHYGGRSERVRGDKIVRLFRAKHQLFQKHWPRRWVGFGAAMLTLWAFSRFVALSMLGLLQKSRRAAAAEWRSVFARRREFNRL
jgi:GT2 family glycosyltransferase